MYDMATRRHRLAERRKAVGYTQEQLAEQLGVERTTVARWEAGDTAPQPWQRPNLATALRLSIDEVTALFADSDDSALPQLAPVQTETESPVESPATILERLQQYSTHHFTDALLDALDIYVDDVIDRYEEEGPASLAPEVVRQRRRLQNILVTCPPSKRGERLAQIAARMSAQLAYMAVNLGRFHSARAYAIEAFSLAEHIADDELKAWVRGTQSFAEYYSGNYRQALEYAVDGQRYAGTGPQAVRLIINGEARALGKLNQPVDMAVGRAYELLHRFPPEPGMSSCISFGVYSEARVASNAATAYLSLQQAPRVLEHARLATAVADASPSIWSQALVRLDTASALTQSTRPDLEQATMLGRAAMAVSRHHRVESVKQRTRDLVLQLGSWQEVAAAHTFIDEARAWLREEPATDDPF
jgi:transcriptional regulator with XRE-family HTH domain